MFQAPGVRSPLTVLITVMVMRIGVGAPLAVALQGERRGLESQTPRSSAGLTVVRLAALHWGRFRIWCCAYGVVSDGSR